MVTTDCVVSTFEPPASIILNYDLDTPIAKVLTIPTWNQGSCKYTETLALDATSLAYSWLTPNLASRTLTINSSGVIPKPAGEYTITVTSTIIGSVVDSVGYIIELTFFSCTSCSTEVINLPTDVNSNTKSLTDYQD